MPRYVDHAGAICAELAGIDGVTLVPHPPVTTMAHLHLNSSKDAFAAATRALARDEKVWTWGEAEASDLPDYVTVELTVGDATLEWTPEEVREVVTAVLERARSSPEA